MNVGSVHNPNSKLINSTSAASRQFNIQHQHSTFYAAHAASQVSRETNTITNIY